MGKRICASRPVPRAPRAARRTRVAAPRRACPRARRRRCTPAAPGTRAAGGGGIRTCVSHMGRAYANACRAFGHALVARSAATRTHIANRAACTRICMRPHKRTHIDSARGAYSEIHDTAYPAYSDMHMPARANAHRQARTHLQVLRDRVVHAQRAQALARDAEGRPRSRHPRRRGHRPPAAVGLHGAVPERLPPAAAATVAGHRVRTTAPVRLQTRLHSARAQAKHRETRHAAAALAGPPGHCHMAMCIRVRGCMHIRIRRRRRCRSAAAGRCTPRLHSCRHRRRRHMNGRTRRCGGRGSAGAGLRDGARRRGLQWRRRIRNLHMTAYAHA